MSSSDASGPLDRRLDEWRGPATPSGCGGVDQIARVGVVAVRHQRHLGTVALSFLAGGQEEVQPRDGRG